MESLSFIPGRAFLSSDSPVVPWTVVFEDEGVAGYFYACDRSQEKHEESILDAMLIYNVAALAKSDAEKSALSRSGLRRWSGRAMGMQAVLYLDGTAQALYDFAERGADTAGWTFRTFSRSAGDLWRKTSHAWSEEALQRFEAALYA